MLSVIVTFLNPMFYLTSDLAVFRFPATGFPGFLFFNHFNKLFNGIAFHVISFVSPPFLAADTPQRILSISLMLCASGLTEIMTPFFNAYGICDQSISNL